jgi:hypothetical protein
VDQVGPPAPGVRFTHVCDRGADNYEVFCHLVLQRSDWVIRTAQLQRSIITPNGERMPLAQYAMGWQPVGSYDLYVQAQNGQPARWVKLEVSFGDILMPAPQQCTPWLKEIGIVTIAMWGIQVHEVDAPAHVKEPLRVPDDRTIGATDGDDVVTGSPFGAVEDHSAHAAGDTSDQSRIEALDRNPRPIAEEDQSDGVDDPRLLSRDGGAWWLPGPERGRRARVANHMAWIQ